MQAILIITISSFFYIYEFFLRVMPSVITNELMHEFGVHATLMSTMTSCFLYAYALMQIPAGLLVDRYGPRKVLTLAVLLCAISTIIFQMTNNIFIAMISRLLLGAASSVAFIAPLTLASRWFDKKHLALIAGLVQLLGCAGAIMGGAPIVYLQQTIGWRQALKWAAFFGLFLALIFWKIIQDYPKNKKQEEKIINNNSWQYFILTIKNKKNIYIGLIAFSTWAAMGSLAELWGIPFLTKFHNLTLHEAALLVMIIWIGVALGSPVAGYWSEKQKNNRIPLLILLFLSFLTSCILIYINSTSKLFVFTNLFLMGFAAGSQPITFALIAENNPSERIGTAFGFNNMAVVCGGSLLQPAIGILLDMFWSGEFDIIRIYSIHDYQMALVIVPLSILLGILITYFFVKQDR